MRLGWIVLLLLSFPMLEALGIFWAASVIGSWVLLWLLLAAVAGIMLIRMERAAWGTPAIRAVRQRTYSPRRGTACLPRLHQRRHRGDPATAAWHLVRTQA